jgi:predicted ATPase/class 3 adenylate cyclase
VGQLPTGKVAFCFTDIEGSTQLLHAVGDAAYQQVLEAHRELIRAAFAGHGGSEVSTEGDGTFFSFDSATGAVLACRQAQQALTFYRWTPNVVVRVRMGIHFGEAIATSDRDYVGIAVHHAARVSAAAHGGQVLATEEVIRESAGAGGVAFQDLGLYRLRGFDQAVRLFDVHDPDDATAFPPPRVPAAVVHNLSVSRTSFVGRSDELRTLTNLVAAVGLITITGPGGMGKTRLATEASIRLADRFDQGAWFVALAPITSGAELWGAVAASLGIVDSAEQTLETKVIDRLASGAMLILLDNCEHLVDACADMVSRWLSECPSLTILATSREAMLLPEEHVLRVGSLTSDAAIQLFAQRAAQSRPGLVFDEPDQNVVPDICHRLEFMPLAIELAAARAATTGLNAVVEELSDTLATLDDGGRRRGDARQQTLRATIDWSYELLSAGDRATFRQLAAFRGGFTESAATTVAGATRQVLYRLVGQSLLEVDPGARPARYRLLEPIRQYAWGLLDVGERDDLMRAHGAWVIELAKEASGRVLVDQAYWQERLEAEYGNISAAIQWSLQRPGDQAALNIVGHLGVYWFTAGHGESLAWIAEALERPDAPPKLRAGALLAGAAVAQLRPLEPWQGEVPTGEAPGFVRSAAWAREAVHILRTTGAPRGLGWALFWLGRAHGEGWTGGGKDRFNDECRAAMQAALGIFRELKDPLGITWCLEWTAEFALDDDQVDAAEAAFEEALEIGRRTGITHATGDALASLGAIAVSRGDYQRGVELTAAAVDHYRQSRDRWQLVGALRRHSLASASRGDLNEAVAAIEEAIDLAIEYRFDDQLGYAMRDVVLIAPNSSPDAVAVLFSVYPHVGSRLPDPRMRERARNLTERYGNQAGPITAARVREATTVAKKILADIRCDITGWSSSSGTMK